MSDIYSNITFIVKQKNKPYYESSAVTGMIPKLYFKTEEKKVIIKDIRKSKKFVLNKNGFTLKKMKFKIQEKDFENNYENYKSDLSRFLKKIIPFKHIEIFDITKRSNRKSGALNKDGPRQPADRAHVDYTVDSGPLRAKQVLEKNFSKNFYKYRIIQLNIWKPLSSIVLSSPLAIADASSISFKDLVATDQIFPDRVGEIYHLAYNKEQKWYWVSEMQDNEVLIFKGWDSINSNKVLKFTPHTSFNLKNQNIKKNPRESIEARAFLVL